MLDQTPRPIPITDRPFNAETPASVLADPLTPTESYFVRSHFDVPPIDSSSWQLTIDGLVERQVRLCLADLKKMPAKTVTLAMECAGNGRASLNPRPEGVAWGYGAAGVAGFTGVPLKHLLDLASPGQALEVVFTAADQGEVAGQTIPFARSLPLAVARLPDTLVAWAMNDVPLTPHHGAPVRLIVPGWYGMASVKWLEKITLVREPFAGHFQHNDYVYLRQQGVADGTPVTMMRVRSVVAHPLDGATLALGEIQIAGAAWSGAGSIETVEISTDDGRTWQQASLVPAQSAYAATPWRFCWRPPGPGRYTLMARATDAEGNTQPLEPVWNLRGYGNNAVQRVTVTIS